MSACFQDCRRRGRAAAGDVSSSATVVAVTARCRSTRPPPASPRSRPRGTCRPASPARSDRRSPTATSSHVGIAGGALASSSCSPNVGEQLVVGERRVVPRGLHRRQVAAPSRTTSTCTSGRDRYSTNAHAAALLSDCSNTARLPPPTNDVPVSLGRLVGDRPGRRVGAGVGDDADHPRSADERADVAVGELCLDRHVGHRRLGQARPRRTSRSTSAPRRTPRSRA